MVKMELTEKEARGVLSKRVFRKRLFHSPRGWFAMAWYIFSATALVIALERLHDNWADQYTIWQRGIIAVLALLVMAAPVMWALWDRKSDLVSYDNQMAAMEKVEAN